MEVQPLEWGPGGEEKQGCGVLLCLSAMQCGLWCLDGMGQVDGFIVIWGTVGAT